MGSGRSAPQGLSALTCSGQVAPNKCPLRCLPRGLAIPGAQHPTSTSAMWLELCCPCGQGPGGRGGRGSVRRQERAPPFLPLPGCSRSLKPTLEAELGPPRCLGTGPSSPTEVSDQAPPPPWVLGVPGPSSRSALYSPGPPPAGPTAPARPSQHALDSFPHKYAAFKI